MIGTVILAFITCLFMMLCILFKPTIKIKDKEIQSFWIVGLVGAFFALIFNLLPFDLLVKKMTTNNIVNPFKILILFICLSIISITLDVLGFFKYLALKVANKFNRSQYSLFFSIFVLVAILTIFTSNDIIILTFTPFICYFAKRLKINPIPFLVMQFITANTFSMALYIGNPTNIYLSQTNGIDFFEYLKVMWLPTLLAGISSLLVLILLFNKDLKQKITVNYTEIPKLENKTLTLLALSILFVCTAILAVSNYLKIEMWIICLISALVLTICILIYSLKSKDNLLTRIYKKVPYNLIAFILSMYVLVEALNYNGVTREISDFLTSVSKSKFSSIMVYGTSSIMFDSLINNIPMSILFSSILSSNFTPFGLYATIIGSNLGAYLTPLASLAGIVWLSMLKKQNVDITFTKFLKYGLIVTPITLFVSLSTLLITI